MDKTTNIRPEIIEEADGIVWQGGEVPEVALYEALHELEQSGIAIETAERRLLEEAVLQRYRDMVHRDLNRGNLGKSIFRGPARAGINWQRLRKFALNHGFDVEPYRKEASELLENYLLAEHAAVESGRDYHTMGLGTAELVDFARELGLDPGLETMIVRLGSVRSLDFKTAIAAHRGAAALGE